MNNTEYSIVVPVFNEEGNIKPLFVDIRREMERLGRSYEIIFINDGSTDRTLDVLREIRPDKVIVFRKNFGQTAALDAGIKAARGRYIITTDGDGQNPPSEIPKLIEKMKDGGYDMVSGWRHKRNLPVRGQRTKCNARIPAYRQQQSRCQDLYQG